MYKFLILTTFLISIYSGPSIGQETRSLLTKCKQDVLARCAGILTFSRDTQASWAQTAPDIVITPQELEAEIERTIAESDEIKSLLDEAQNQGVKLDFTDDTLSDLYAYAYQNLRRKKGDTRFHAARFDNRLVSIFPFIGHGTDLKLKLDGEKKSVEKLKRKISSMFFAINVNVKFYDKMTEKNWTLSAQELIQNQINLPKSLLSGQLDFQLDEILKILESASRYELELDSKLAQFIKTTFLKIDFKVDKTQTKVALAIWQNSNNLGYTKSLMQEIDPEGKLAKLFGEKYTFLSEKKVLTATPLGKGIGATASQLGITQVTHQTRENIYLSITSNKMGKPNLTVSRTNKSGELARRGEGFYTLKGKDWQWDPNYGDYKAIFRVNPNARIGTDFYLFNNEVIFTNLSALELDESVEEELIRPIDFYSRVLKGDREYELFRSVRKVQSELVLNHETRIELDQLALKTFTNAKSITEVDEYFLSLYFKLPIKTEAGKEAIAIAAKLMGEFTAKRNDGRIESIFSTWLNGQHYNSYPSIIMNYIDRPKFNNVYIVDNFTPFIRSKLMQEEWFINFIKNSPHLTHIMSTIESYGKDENAKEVLSKLKAYSNSGCRDSLLKLIRL